MELSIPKGLDKFYSILNEDKNFFPKRIKNFDVSLNKVEKDPYCLSGILITDLTFSKYNILRGIYRLTCKTTNRVYIGSSIDIITRLQRHRLELKNHKHTNKYLYYVYQKYGGWDNFTVEILELCEKEELLIKEKYYFDIHKNTMNLKEPLRGGGTPKNYKIRSPEGVILEINNIAKFSRENNLNDKLLGMVANGKRRIHKGYTSLTYESKPMKQVREFSLVSPEGVVYKQINVSKFCREHKLCAKNIFKVLNGERPHAQGWTLLK